MDEKSGPQNWESLRKWTLESVSIDKGDGSNPSNNDNVNDNILPPPPQSLPAQPPLPKSTSKSTLARIGSNFKGSRRNSGASTKVVGGGPRLGRQQSGALRGLNSLRFLDKKNIGKEGDGWKDVEKRFSQMSMDGRLSRDKFGICVGIKKAIYIYILTFQRV